MQASGIRHKDIPQLKKDTFRLIGDYESQQQMLKALGEQADELHKFLLTTGGEHPYRKFFSALDAFIEVYNKLLFESAGLVRKNRALEEARHNLQQQNIRYKQRLGIITDDILP